MTLSHLAKRRQHNSPALGLEVGRDKGKLLPASVSIACRHVDLAEDSHRADAACVQRVIAHGTLGRPIACEEHAVGILQPRSFGLLDPFKVLVPELLTAMENIDVVAERAIAPSYVGALRPGQNPWRKSVEKIQARIGLVLRMNLVSNRLQPALGEEKKAPCEPATRRVWTVLFAIKSPAD